MTDPAALSPSPDEFVRRHIGPREADIAEMLKTVNGFSVVSASGESDWTRDLRIALSERRGPIVPLVTEGDRRLQELTRRSTRMVTPRDTSSRHTEIRMVAA